MHVYPFDFAPGLLAGYKLTDKGFEKKWEVFQVGDSGAALLGGLCASGFGTESRIRTAIVAHLRLQWCSRMALFAVELAKPGRRLEPPAAGSAVSSERPSWAAAALEP